MVAAAPVPVRHAPLPAARAEAFRSRMLTRRAHGSVTTKGRNCRTWSGEGLHTSLGAHRQHRAPNADKTCRVWSRSYRASHWNQRMPIPANTTM